MLKSLADFNNKFAKVVAARYLPGAIAKLESGEFAGFSLLAFVRSEVSGLISGSVKHAESLVQDAGCYHEHIRFLEEPFEVVDVVFDEDNAEIENVVELDEERVFIQFNIPCATTLDAFILKSDYWEMVEDTGNTLAIMDGDWNKHYMLVQASIDSRMTVNVTLNVESEEVESFEVESLTTIECKDRPKKPSYKVAGEH